MVRISDIDVPLDTETLSEEIWKWIKQFSFVKICYPGGFKLLLRKIPMKKIKEVFSVLSYLVCEKFEYV